MNRPLMHELQLHEYLHEKIASDFPDIDEDTLADTLEGLTDLHEKIVAVVRSQQEDRVMASALKERTEEMQTRLKKFEYRAEKKRELIATVMDRDQIMKITEPDLTISLRPMPLHLFVSDESCIQEL